MATGGYFGYDDPDLNDKIDHDGDRDDEQEVDRTHQFKPGQASTPYHGGEQLEMQTRQHEQSGMPDTSYDETPLLGHFIDPEEKQSAVDRTSDFIKRRFPKVGLKKIGPVGYSKKGAQADIVSFGPQGGETKILKKDGSVFLKRFTDKFSKSLRPSAEQLKMEDRDTQEERERLKISEKELRELNEIVAKRNKELDEMKI